MPRFVMRPSRLAGPDANLVKRRAHFTERLLVAGAYAIWIGTLLAAVIGTSRATPIAGAGFAGARWQEITVSLILMLGSLASLVGAGSVLFGLIHRTRASAENLSSNTRLEQTR